MDEDWKSLTIRELKALNKRVIDHLRYEPSAAGLADWTSWRKVWRRGHGDCLDMAICKAGLLRDEHGFAPEQLMLVCDNPEGVKADHAWLAVRLPYCVVRLDWRLSVIQFG